MSPRIMRREVELMKIIISIIILAIGVYASYRLAKWGLKARNKDD